MNFLAYFMETSIPRWVDNVRLYFDNASTNKNQYFIAILAHLVLCGRFGQVYCDMMVPGHTKVSFIH